MKQYKTLAAITALSQTSVSMKDAEKGVLTFDEKHFKFGFFNVAYSNIKSAKILTEGTFLLKKHYLVVSDENRRYQFGPFKSCDFLKELPIPFDG